MNEKEIKKIIEENRSLKRKLEVAKKWMEREVKNQIALVAKKKFKKIDDKDMKNMPYSESEITEQIISYFWDILLLNAPKDTIDAITASEIHYHNMKSNPKLDGLAVISGYHKVFDALIESFLTKWFRKYAKKQKHLSLRVNDPIEKSLNLVISKNYILGTGRLYALLNMIRKGSELHDLGRCFDEYLNRHPEIKEILLDPDFFHQFTRLNRMEVLWRKRHKGMISFDDTKEAREMLLWNLKNEKAIFHVLMKSLSWI